jgi:hypothetical protein
VLDRRGERLDVARPDLSERHTGEGKEARGLPGVSTRRPGAPARYSLRSPAALRDRGQRGRRRNNQDSPWKRCLYIGHELAARRQSISTPKHRGTETPRH